MYLAKRANEAERERIAHTAEQWAEDAQIARLIERLRAVRLSANAPHVPADWRERCAENPPDCAGDD